MHTGAPGVVGGSDGGEKLNLYGGGWEEIISATDMEDMGRNVY